MVPESYYTALSAVLFAVGAVGVVIRRNPLVIFMSIELMLNAANLALVAFGHRLGNLEGQALVFFVMAVAAAEVAVGLAIIVTIFLTKQLRVAFFVIRELRFKQLTRTRLTPFHLLRSLNLTLRSLLLPFRDGLVAGLSEFE